MVCSMPFEATSRPRFAHTPMVILFLQLSLQSSARRPQPKPTSRAASVMDTPLSNSSARLPISFGYPACPRLEDQAQLFRLLEVEEKLGVRRTEGYMMDPESSVSALVFHNPMARYFSLSPADIERLEREFPEGAR